MNIAPGLKLLFLDIETRPALGYFWGLHKENISVEQIVEPGGMMCFSAKWHQQPKVYFYADWACGHRAMIRAAHALLSKADAVCHFKGESFDVPIINTEFIKHGFKPTPPIPQIDLYKVVSRKFRTISNRLMFWGPFLEIGEKVKHEGFDLWRGCMDGDPKKQALMQAYNIQDTRLLEPFYEKALPWIDGHPNRGLYVRGLFNNDGSRKPQCPLCGAPPDQLRSEGLRRATTHTYRRYHCNNCGAWTRERLSTRLNGPPPVLR